MTGFHLKNAKRAKLAPARMSGHCNVYLLDVKQSKQQFNFSVGLVLVKGWDGEKKKVMKQIERDNISECANVGKCFFFFKDSHK